MSFEKQINFVRDGETVSAGVTNRAPWQIAQNQNYLYEWLKASGIGATIYAREVPVSETVKTGMAVYYNPATQQYEEALADTEIVADTQQLVTSIRSQVWGIVAVKHHAKLADVLLGGVAKIDIREAVQGGLPLNETAPAGIYYLSAMSPGKLTRVKPSVLIGVLQSDGAGNVHVRVTFSDVLNQHQHYRFDLVVYPAGQHTPVANVAHQITSPNPALPGWLPATHAIFEGNAPAGAKFGYNLSQHPALAAVWPPVPLQSYELTCQHASIRRPAPREAIALAGSVLNDRVTVDRNGIWWMTDCYDEVPWPADYNSASPPTYTLTACPLPTEHKLVLWFTKLTFTTETSAVTSLRSLDERLRIYCRDTQETASVGDLDLLLDLSLGIDSLTTRGHLVFKELEGDKFNLGPVAEGVYATSENVLITSTSQNRVISGDLTSPVLHQGIIGIGVLSQATREVSANLTRLDGATEENDPVLHIGLSPVYPSGFISSFFIPADVPTGSLFSIRFRLLGRISGNLPPVIAEYKKILRPTAGLTVPETAAVSWTSLALDTETVLAVANGVVEATTATLAVTAGDIVYVRITRDPESLEDTYSGELGILQQTGLITTAGG